MKTFVVIAGLAAGMAVSSLQTATAQEKGGDKKPFGSLNLSEPVVGLKGPYPTAQRKAKVGDLIQVQIRYPIAPPFPESAELSLNSRALGAVGAYLTGGQVAILKPEPQKQGIGVGYISAYVKAMNATETAQFTVRVRMSDGSVHNVPFSFRIAGAGEEK